MFDNKMPGMDMMSDMNKQMMANVAQFSEIAVDVQRKLANQQMAAFEANLGAFTKVLDAVIEGKQPAELYALQVETTQALSEEMMSFAKDAWEVQVEARDKVAKMVSEAEPFEAMKPAAAPKTAAKKAA